MNTIQIKSSDLSGQFVALAVVGDDQISACLDLETGCVQNEEFCKVEETGDGHDAVVAGKRFVRIPPMNDLMRSYSEQFIELVKQLHSEGRMSDCSAEIHQGNEHLVAFYISDAVAQEWIKTIRPKCRIEWVDDACFESQIVVNNSGKLVFLDKVTEKTTLVYDPQTCEWHKRSPDRPSLRSIG